MSQVLVGVQAALNGLSDPAVIRLSMATKAQRRRRFENEQQDAASGHVAEIVNRYPRLFRPAAGQ